MNIVEQVVRDSGLWSNGRECSHRFVLSPSTYTISTRQQTDLARLGRCLGRTMLGLCRIAAIALNPKVGNKPAWKRLCATFTRGVPLPMREVWLLEPEAIPAVYKVDLIETIDGEYRIAELDAQNKHGLGYSTLAANIRRAVARDARCYPGVAEQIATAIRSHDTNEALLVFADHERFYQPEFEILKEALSFLGVELAVANEVDLDSNEIVQRSWSFNDPLILVDFPMMNRNIPLRDTIARRYMEGGIRFLIPPKPYLGSKGMLAVLRNDESNADLEAILNEYIGAETLVTVREFIPRTYLLQPKHTSLDVASLTECSRYLLKRTISSGMKGVHFPDDPGFYEVLAEAVKMHGLYILQEIVPSATRPFQYYNGTSELHSADWYMRITSHFAAGEVADVIVTACLNDHVHGSKSCLQIGACLE